MVAEEHAHVIGPAGLPANGRCSEQAAQEGGEHGMHPLVVGVRARVFGEHGFLGYQGGAFCSSQLLALRKVHRPTGNGGWAGAKAQFGQVLESMSLQVGRRWVLQSQR